MPQGVSVFGGEVQKLVAEIGERLGQSLGQAIAVSLVHALEAGAGSPGSHASSGVVGKASSRPAGGRACQVPGCTRAQAAKGLCPTHYRKARRLSFRAGSLTPGNLATLAEDGRKTRHEK